MSAKSGARRRSSAPEAAAEKLEQSFGRDLALIVVVVLLLTAAAMAVQVYDRIRDGIGDVELDLNALVPFVLLSLGGAVVFALMRNRAAKKMAERLAAQSYVDELTGLGNRKMVERELNRTVAAGDRSNSRVGVVLVDLVDFRSVNDALGLEIGDALIQKTADRLRKAAGAEQTVLRSGDDEFLIIAPDVLQLSAIERLASRLLAAAEKETVIDGQPIQPRISMGAAMSEPGCPTPIELLRDADASRRDWDGEPGKRVVVHDRGARNRLAPSVIDRRLLDAIENDEFTLYFQPIVSLWTNQIVAVESLLRWEDPDRGIRDPAEFLPSFERTGLLSRLGTWVIDESCRQAVRWREAYPDRPPIVVNANITSHQLTDGRLVSVVERALGESGLAPTQLCLEMTDSGSILDLKEAWMQLREISSMGVLLGLDDFGAGTSTLMQLRDFDLDEVKIHRSFIERMGTTREDSELVAHIIAIAKSLRISTVAVGVEDEAQVDILRATGCDAAQGLYFSPAQPAEQIDALLSGVTESWSPTTDRPEVSAREFENLIGDNPRQATPAESENGGGQSLPDLVIPMRSDANDRL